MKRQKPSVQPLHRIFLSNEFRPMLRLLGKKAKDQISEKMNAEYESRIAICLDGNIPRKSNMEISKKRYRKRDH